MIFALLSFVLSGCAAAPKVVKVFENPPKIYIDVPRMKHPEANTLAEAECKKLNPSYSVDRNRTYGKTIPENVQDLKDSWLGLKPIVQSIRGIWTFHCK